MRYLAQSLHWLAGPVIWAAAFLAIYVSESLICSRGLAPETHRALCAVVIVVSALAVLAIAHRNRRGNDFQARLGRALALLSLLALSWLGLATAMLPACQ